jgi:glutamate-ammonia-ligase adenylyltransferase
MAGLANRDVMSGLDGAVAAGLLDVAQAQTLKDSYDLCWSVQCAARLLSGKVIEADKIGEGGAAFLCRATGFEQVEALQSALQDSYSTATEMIGSVIKEDEDGAQH